MEFTTIDIRQVMTANPRGVAVGQERLRHQFWTQEGPTNTDIDHVCDRFIAIAAP
ncbi:hypothetical protein D3C85_1760290 [compost metagenome]